MKKHNIQKTREEKEFIRCTAVKMLVKGVMTRWKIVKFYAISYTALKNREKRYKKWWMKALRAKKNKGWRPKDESKNLTNKEKKLLQDTLKYEPSLLWWMFAELSLWTIDVIIMVIKHLFEKDIKYWKVRQLLNEFWYTNQKPIFKAYQQNPEKVLQRVEEDLPAIYEEAKQEDREIFYWDEAWFKTCDNKWMTWAPKWETPTVLTTWNRFWVNAISIVSSRWELRFMVYEWSFTWDTLIQFLKRLIKNTDQKYTLILDWHPTHKSKKVNEYLESIDHQVKIYFLPWYSPELNPDEQVRYHTKNNLKWRRIANKQQLIDKVKKELFSLQKQKEKVASFFRHPKIPKM
jgi:transposase